MGTTVFHITEEYLNEKYDFRNNTISLDIEYKLKDSNKWQSANASNLWLELQKENIKIGDTGVKAVLKSEFSQKFNPIINYFDNLPKWNGKTDYIKQYAAYVELIDEREREAFVLQFKKWLVRTVKTVKIDQYFNKQAFVLADHGKGQNIGKTTYLRNIMPKELNSYIAEDISNDKDARVLLCKNLIINMDELEALSRKEINHLKAYFTKTQINERLPYEPKNSIIPRIASFMGSTNQSSFLRDETGSVRWLVFGVKSIDWSYSEKFNINNLWAQAVALAEDKTFKEKLTRKEIVENELRNNQYKVTSKEQELIYKLFRHPRTDEIGDFLTATDVAEYLKNNSALNAMPYNGTIGKALHALGYERIQKKKDENDNFYIWGYQMVKKQINELE